MKKNTLALSKKLISIPSYVGGDCDEQKLGQFLFDYLQNFPWLKVVKQPVKNGRFNLIVHDNYPTKVLICGHIDTVSLRNGWKTNPFISTVLGNKLFGLGATDMKGNMAAFLIALGQVEPTKGLMFLLYVDEEYDFLGMKAFIEAYKKKIKPSLVISLDGRDLSLGLGCRGLIELKLIIKGKTGHASQSQTGNNAILGGAKVVSELAKYLKKNFSTKSLGRTTCNLAFLQGGLDLRSSSNLPLLIGSEGNNIADVAEVVLDIRPGSSNLNAKKVVLIIKRLLKANRLNLESYKIRHDFAPWITKKGKVNTFKKIVEDNLGIKYLDPIDFGFIDTQMIWAAFDKVPCLTFGAGGSELAHKPNEYVEIDKLQILERILVEYLKNLKGGDKNG